MITNGNRTRDPGLVRENEKTLWLDNARIAAIVGVIVIHASADLVLQSNVGTSAWWAGNLYDSFSRWCVPVFVMISGALQLDPNKQEDWSTFYRKRLSRIGVPLLFWSLFYLVWNYEWSRLDGAPLTRMQLARMLFSGRPAFHMWFVFMIATLYIVAPFLQGMIKSSSRGELRIFLILGFCLAILNSITEGLGLGGNKFWFNWFLMYIPYFVLGHVISTSNIRVSVPVLVTAICGFGTITAAGTYFASKTLGSGSSLILYSYLGITVVPMSILSLYWMKTWQWPWIRARHIEALSKATFGIYLVHVVFMDVLQRAKVSPSLFAPAISIPCLTALVLVLSAATVLMVLKIPYLRRIV